MKLWFARETKCSEVDSIRAGVVKVFYRGVHFKRKQASGSKKRGFRSLLPAARREEGWKCPGRWFKAKMKLFLRKNKSLRWRLSNVHPGAKVPEQLKNSDSLRIQSMAGFQQAICTMYMSIKSLSNSEGCSRKRMNR